MRYARLRSNVILLIAASSLAVGCGVTSLPASHRGISTVIGLGDAKPSDPPGTGRISSIVAANTGFWTVDIAGNITAADGAPTLDPVVMPPNSFVLATDAIRPPGSNGLWVLRSDGGVIARGDAPYADGTWGRAAGSAVGIAAHTGTDGKADGGWVLYADGWVVPFGAAPDLGSAGMRAVPAADIASTPTGQGLWAIYEDGSLAVLGDAPFLGDVPGRTATAIVAAPGGGYVILHGDGSISPSPGAKYFGDALGQTPLLTAVDATYTAAGTGTFIASTFVPPPAPDVPDEGLGRRIVYSNSQQRVWVINADESIVLDVRVSGKRGVPHPGTYHVYKKNTNGSSGSLRLPWFTSFARGNTTDIGFHGIPLRPNGSPIQSDAQLGTPLSHGCVRMNQQDVKVLYDWARIGDPVIVLP